MCPPPPPKTRFASAGIKSSNPPILYRLNDAYTAPVIPFFDFFFKNYAHFVSAKDAYTAPVFIYSACKRGREREGKRERERGKRKEGKKEG
jgi:hypothetical protein